MRSNVIIDSYVDIRLYPKPSFDADMTEVTFSDLHANALLLLYSLVRKGFVDIPRDKYQQFAAFYSRGELHPRFFSNTVTAAAILSSSLQLYQLIIEFNDLLSYIKVVDKKRLIRLIGDDVVDRGVNDYFVLKIFELLHVQGAFFEIMGSNHGIEFVEACEKFTANNNEFIVTKLNNLQFGNSMYALQRTIASGAVDAQEILDIYNNVYKKHLKILSYALDFKANEMRIFSHAGIGFEQIEALAKRLGVRWSVHCVLDMAKNIDLINDEFGKYVQDNKVHELQFDEIFDEILDTKTMVANKVIFDIVWSREYAHLQRKSSVFKVIFVHGHDNDDPDPDQITLNSNLGKFNNYFGQFECYTTNGRHYAVVLDTWMSALDDIAKQAVELHLQGKTDAGTKVHQIYLELSKKTMDLYPAQNLALQTQCNEILFDACEDLKKEPECLNVLIEAVRVLEDLVRESVCDSVKQVSNSFLFFKNIERCHIIENLPLPEIQAENNVILS